MLHSKSRFKSALLMGLASTLFLCSAAQANYPNYDPCRSLNGYWTGVWQHKNSDCSWDIMAIATRDLYNNVNLTANAYNGRPIGKCESTRKFVLNGWCNNGFVKLSYPNSARTIEGEVTGDRLSLKDFEYQAYFRK